MLYTPGSAGQRALVFLGAALPSTTMVAPSGMVRMWTSHLPSGIVSVPKKRRSRLGFLPSSDCGFTLSKTGEKLIVWPSATVASVDASLKPALRTVTLWNPFSTVICAGVTMPLSIASIHTFATWGLLVTTIVETAGANSAVTSMLLPATDSTDFVCCRKPDLVKTMVCGPAARCDAVNGVTQLGSLHPSISTLALSGCESNFNSLCATKTLFGELVAFGGAGSFFAFVVFLVGKNFTVVSGAITSLFSGVGAGTAIAIGSRAASCISLALAASASWRIFTCVR